jgi:cytochrome c556
VKRSRFSLALLAAITTICFAAAGVVTGIVGAADERVASKGAPNTDALPRIDDVASQLLFYAERLEESLAEAEAYDESKQTRVEKDAATVAALAALLDRHTAEHAKKPAAQAMAAAGKEISANFRDHSKATAANGRLKQALAADDKSAESSKESSSSSASPANRSDHAATPMLMKQIRFIENRLKRAARRADSKKHRSEVAGYAATIAALAAPLAADAAHFAKQPELQRQWKEESDLMSAAAAKLNLAAHDEKADLAAAVRALDASCARCHAEFR